MDEELRKAIADREAARSRVDELPADVPAELVDGAMADLAARQAMVNEIIARRREERRSA